MPKWTLKFHKFIFSPKYNLSFSTEIFHLLNEGMSLIEVYWPVQGIFTLSLLENCCPLSVSFMGVIYVVQLQKLLGSNHFVILHGICHQSGNPLCTELSCTKLIASTIIAYLKGFQTFAIVLFLSGIMRVSAFIIYSSSWPVTVEPVTKISFSFSLGLPLTLLAHLLTLFILSVAIYSLTSCEYLHKFLLPKTGILWLLFTLCPAK